MKVPILVLLATLVLGTSPSSAQNTAALSQEQLNARYEELVGWLKQYRKWEKWIDAYGNRPSRNGFGLVASKRMQRPEPPPWLYEDCANLIGHEGKLGEACEIIRTWRGLPWHLKTLQDSDPVLTNVGGVVNDRVVKSSFWQRVHLTGMWTPGQIPHPPLYGVVGMQVGVVEIGRLTLPAIGVMLVTMDGADGTREWKPATSISVSVRLANFHIHKGTEAALHFNVSRLNIHEVKSVGPADLPVPSNFIGLSLSFKKTR